MKFAVEAIVPECAEEPPLPPLMVGDVVDDIETEDIDEAKDWAWQKMEEGYAARMWRR